MKELAYYDGEIGSPEELRVPFNDRSHFFGDGVYDATVSGHHKPFLLEDHLDRFYSSAKALQINIGMDKSALGDLLTDLDSRVEGNAHLLYWQITRGVETRNHAFNKDQLGKLWVLVRPKKLNNPDIPVRLITLEDTRFYHCNIKTLNLLPSVMASQKAESMGAFESVFHRGPIVTECAHSNVSILKDGIFRSHPNDNLILRGISKTHMISACYRLGVMVEERPFTLEELMDADEVIVTSSTNFCLHASHIDGQPVGGKDPSTLKAIQDEVIGEYLRSVGAASLND